MKSNCKDFKEVLKNERDIRFSALQPKTQKG